MTFNGTLKPYQVDAVDKMVARKKMLVAYEMGLGKTCMTIAAVEKLKENGFIIFLPRYEKKYKEMFGN